jgi:molybdenum cofactor synthesis domain-containing protein
VAAVVSLADAQRELLAACPRVRPSDLPLGEAAGCVVATAVAARNPVPPFDNSAVDGYAVRSRDVAAASNDSPVTLTVLGSVLAGSVANAPLGDGQAWKVMTGAMVPAGADAIVMVEDTSADRDAPAASAGDTVEVRAAVPPEAGIRRSGSDVNVGDIVAAESTVLRPADLGVLASVGLRTVRVYPRLRVGLLVTGDELVSAERPLEPGEIYESNAALLAALLEQANCLPLDLGVAGDDPDALAKRLVDAARGCDAIVTTGGVSMGDADPVKAALASLGRLHALQVQIRPAKPFAYAVLDGPSAGVPVFGLPGNPVSSLVSFELLARPALRSMMGHLTLHRQRIQAVADDTMRGPGRDGRTTYLRVSSQFAADGRLHVRPVAGQDSHQLASAARADALAELPPGAVVMAGGEVSVQSLVWD